MVPVAYIVPLDYSEYCTHPLTHNWKDISVGMTILAGMSTVLVELRMPTHYSDYMDHFGSRNCTNFFVRLTLIMRFNKSYN